MNSKISTALVIILVAAVSILAIQNYRMHKKVEELSAPKEEVKITPVIPEQTPANPAGASPFDKPNIDPLANQFPPPKARTLAPESGQHATSRVARLGRLRAIPSAHRQRLASCFTHPVSALI